MSQPAGEMRLTVAGGTTPAKELLVVPFTSLTTQVTTGAAGSRAAVEMTSDPATGGTIAFTIPRGDKGDQGDPGKDGSNVVPTDTAIAQALNNASSATRAAADLLYGAGQGINPDDYAGTDQQRLQAAVTAALAADRPVVLARQYDLTGAAPVLIDKPGGWADRSMLRIVGVNGGGVTKDSAGAIWSSSEANTGDIFAFNLVYNSTNLAQTVVWDCDKLIRIQSLGCNYSSVDHVLYQDDPARYVQSVRLIGEHAISGAGAMIKCCTAYDLTVDNCLIEDRQGSVFANIALADAGAAQNYIVRIVNCVIENILSDVPAINLGVCASAIITGNYFEYNAGWDIATGVVQPDAYSLGIAIKDNLFIPRPERQPLGCVQVGNGPDAGHVASAGNYVDGVLYRFVAAYGGSVTSTGDSPKSGSTYPVAAPDNGRYRLMPAVRSGATSTRPKTPRVGDTWFDSTLNKPVWAKTAGERHQIRVTVSANATATGNVTLTLDGTARAVPVTAGESAATIAARIASLAWQWGWMVLSQSTGLVALMRGSAGPATATYSAGSTGATGTIDYLAAGANAVWVDSTGATA